MPPQFLIAVITVLAISVFYMGCGIAYMWMSRYDIRNAMRRASTKEIFWFAIRVAFTWPWVKISRGENNGE